MKLSLENGYDTGKLELIQHSIRRRILINHLMYNYDSIAALAS